MLRRFKILIYFLLITMSASAQEMWGISNSNFSGNMGIFLNPSTIVRAPYQYEINLIALDAFAENTYFYFPKGERIIPRTISGKTNDGKNYYPEGSGPQNGFSHTLIIGPSYIHNTKDYSWGIHSAFRSEASILKIPSELALLIYDDFRSPTLYGTRYSTTPFSSAYASWFELGGTYGKIYRESEKQLIKWAANGNILLGQNGYYYDERALDFTSVDTSQLIVHKMDATLAHSPNTSDAPFLGIRGLGLSTTLGATYIKNPNRGAFDCNMSNDHMRKYKYRLGVSLIDLGMIHFFNKPQIYTVSTQSDYVWNGIDTIKSGTFHGLDSTLYANLGGEIKDQNFSIWLPLALSVQFDYQVKPNLFANLSIVNRIHFAANQIARGNQINAAVRYERRRYEGSLNFTLFEYKQPSLGLGLRYRFFVIGSDRLLQMLGLSDVKSADFFFGIKFQFCKKPFSKGPDCPAYLSQ
jgi:hypothetical protein